MKSAFALLLEEARDRLRAKYRMSVPLHFDWEPDAAPERSWTVWYFVEKDSRGYGSPIMYEGSAGEQALRRLVEALRQEPA